MDYDLDSETRMMLEVERLARREASVCRRIKTGAAALRRRLAVFATTGR